MAGRARQIGPGQCALVGVTHTDRPAGAARLAERLSEADMSGPPDLT